MATAASRSCAKSSATQGLHLPSVPGHHLKPSGHAPGLLEPAADAGPGLPGEPGSLPEPGFLPAELLRKPQTQSGCQATAVSRLAHARWTVEEHGRKLQLLLGRDPAQLKSLDHKASHGFKVREVSRQSLKDIRSGCRCNPPIGTRLRGLRKALITVSRLSAGSPLAHTICWSSLAGS
jgi:hypothetical protein